MSYKTFGWFGWLCVVAAVIVLLTPVFTFALSIQDSERLRNTLSVAAPAGTLLALGALLLKIRDDSKATLEVKSKFYLEASLAAYEGADQQLRNGNNERVCWIQASRMLAHAKALSASVKDEKHLLVLEVHLLKYREVFNRYCTSHRHSFFMAWPN